MRKRRIRIDRLKWPSSGGWGKWQFRRFGVLDLPAGRQRIAPAPGGPTATEVGDIRRLVLVPEEC